MRHRRETLALCSLILMWGCAAPPSFAEQDAGPAEPSDGALGNDEGSDVLPNVTPDLGTEPDLEELAELEALGEDLELGDLELGDLEIAVPDAPESTWDVVTVDHTDGTLPQEDGDEVILDSLQELKSGRDWVLPGTPRRHVLRATPWRRATGPMRALGVRRYRAFYSFQGHGNPYAVRLEAEGFAPRRGRALLSVRVNPAAVSRRHTLAQTLPLLEASVPLSWQGAGSATARARASERIARQLFVASFRELRAVGDPGPGRGLTIGVASTVPKAFGANDGVCDGGVADFWSCMLTLAPIIACASNPVGAAICGIAAAFALETAQALFSGVSGTAGCSGAIWVLATETNDCRPGSFDVDVNCRAAGYDDTQVGTMSFRAPSSPGAEGYIYRNETQSFLSSDGTGWRALVMAGPVARYNSYVEVPCRGDINGVIPPPGAVCWQSTVGFARPNYYRKTCQQWCPRNTYGGVSAEEACRGAGLSSRAAGTRATGPGAPDRSTTVGWGPPPSAE